ncbi:MAG: N-acetylneuraminate synthase family protein [Candidatus Peribacteraceae bacterium]|nr:N-acetylneuraminate synthase family protein [Candidatus Peribacteraceae bacterium]
MTPVLIIAEIGSVHDGSFGNALKLIELAKECGADAVKFQTHIADAETLKDAPSPSYFTAEPRHDYFRRTAFSETQWKELKKHADKTGIEFLSSPFSIEAVELLERVGMKRYKIPSGETTNLPLLEAVARTGKPVLLSSGMNSWEELDRAVETIRKHHNDITVLQCTSEYPCPYEQVGINVLAEMRERYQLPVGLSDHTLTTFAPLVAVAHGAAVIEKHLTFSRSMYGSDAAHSLEPVEFTHMTEGIRATETMLAHPVDKSDANRFRDMKDTFEKSIVSVAAIAKGTTITEHMLALKKPGTGLPSRLLPLVIGCTAMRDIPAHTLLQAKDLKGFAPPKP